MEIKTITEHLKIYDKDRVKLWMRKDIQLGEFEMLGQRGRRKVYIDQERQVAKLKRENQMLKNAWKFE